ncbi:MAG: 50S ribosomal protein L23 [Candidatus Aenigmatarchaeota archaeon]
MAEKKTVAKTEKKPMIKSGKGMLPVEPWQILQYPMLTEKALSRVETENKLVFIVRRDANKKQIKWAAEHALGVKVDNVKTIIDQKGRKKAVIKLTKDFPATDVAMRFGML